MHTLGTNRTSAGRGAPSHSSQHKDGPASCFAPTACPAHTQPTARGCFPFYSPQLRSALNISFTKPPNAGTASFPPTTRLSHKLRHHATTTAHRWPGWEWRHWAPDRFGWWGWARRPGRGRAWWKRGWWRGGGYCFNRPARRGKEGIFTWGMLGPVPQPGRPCAQHGRTMNNEWTAVFDNGTLPAQPGLENHLPLSMLIPTWEAGEA